MNDEEFDELLRDAAATYNPPPAPPREAMWEAIASARSAQVLVPIQGARRFTPWVIGSAAAAAVLLIGIAIGRQSRAVDATTKLVASVSPTASAANAPHVRADTSIGEVGSTVSSHSDSRHSSASHGLTRRLAAKGPRDRTSPSGAPTDAFNDADAYRLAVIEHLTRTEVLLTDFRAEARSGKPAKLDAQFASISRDLLGTTRMLLATRRGEDPVMTRLLQDLEYVLMQLSQYANDGRGVDLDAINQSIDRRNVLPKLRYSIPAGVSASAGT